MHDRLRELGYRPTHDIMAEVQSMVEDLLPYRDRIGQYQDALLPDVHRDGSHRRKVEYIGEQGEEDWLRAAGQR